MIARSCQPPGGDGRLVAPLLEQIDCQVGSYVEASYASMFGPFGFLEPVLTGALTLYIAFYGFQLIVGRGSISLTSLAPKVLLIGLVLAFATRWGAYQALFLNLFYGGADQLAVLLIDGGNGRAAAAASAFDRLDTALQNIIRIANTWNENSALPEADNLGAAQARSAAAAQAGALQDAQGVSLPRSAGAVNLLWFSAILLALSTVGVLIIAKILLGLLLAVGPVLVVLALFTATRGLFEGWLKTLALYALLAAFATVLTGGVLFLVEPMIGQIEDARNAGDASPQPVFVLAVTVFIFALLMMQLFRLCSRLTSSWRLPIHQQDRDQAAAPSSSDQASSGIAAAVNSRVGDIIVAVERGAATFGGDRRAGATAGAVNTGPVSPGTYGSRRTGQRYCSYSERLGAKGKLA
ncbi:MAG: type IV secretion system protein [Pseudomonadota bacterium]